MKTAASVLVGIVACGYPGFWPEMGVACDILDAWNNLCGMVGVFVKGPLGAIAGGVGGWALSRRRGR